MDSESATTTATRRPTLEAKVSFNDLVRAKNRRIALERKNKGWNYRLDEQMEFGILRFLYNHGACNRYRLMYAVFTDSRSNSLRITRLVEKGLIKQLGYAKRAKHRSRMSTPHFVITKRGIIYMNKIAIILELLGLRLDDFVGAE